LKLFTAKRLTVWGTGLFALSWFLYVHTMWTPGLLDRAGRFKSADYVQFYVMGSLVRDGQTGGLYDPQAHLAEGRRRIASDLGIYAAHPNYGPQVALAFAPLAALPFGASLLVFLLLSAVGYGVAVWMVWRDCDALRPHGRVVAVLAAASPLFVIVVRYGQASAVSLLACALALTALRRERGFLAGLAIGCLVYKPQLGILFAIVFLVARQWRVVSGALVAVAVQLGLGWWLAGSQTMMRYGSELWLLARDPGLIQIHPSELHSIRGLVHLLVPSEPVVALVSAAALVAAIVLAVRTWSSNAPLEIRFGEVILLTILASPHLITYDLLLLTVPLMAFANRAVADGERADAIVYACLLLLYFAPFSAMFARLTGVQASVLVMALLAWKVSRQSSVVSPRSQSSVLSHSRQSSVTVVSPQLQSSVLNHSRQSSITVVSPQSQSAVLSLGRQSSVSVVSPQSEPSVLGRSRQSSVVVSFRLVTGDCDY